jgi:hypothetical protein
MTFRGARYIHILVPCPLGWGTASQDTMRLARLAKETGVFPVFEAEHGELKSTSTKIRRLLPVEEYLRPQKRFAHLFGKNPAVATIARMQALADKNIRRFGSAQQGGALMTSRFAITLDPGSSLANRTGSWRTERPVYLDKLPPCNNQCPAGEDIQGWLFHAESGNYEKAWRHLTEGQSLPGDHGPRLLPHLRGACNRGQLDSPVGINSVERFLGDEAIKQGWKLAEPASRIRQARADRRRRPVGHVGRLSPAPARPPRDGA